MSLKYNTSCEFLSTANIIAREKSLIFECYYCHSGSVHSNRLMDICNLFAINGTCRPDHIVLEEKQKPFGDRAVELVTSVLARLCDTIFLFF